MRANRHVTKAGVACFPRISLRSTKLQLSGWLLCITVHFFLLFLTYSLSHTMISSHSAFLNSFELHRMLSIAFLSQIKLNLSLPLSHSGYLWRHNRGTASADGDDDLKVAQGMSGISAIVVAIGRVCKRTSI